MSSLIEQVRSSLTEAIDNDQLVLPTLPEVALKIREAAEDPDVDVASFCKVIESDAAISARIIKVTNSPLFRASQPIEDLRMAVNRLGITYTCNLATGLAMEQMFQATTQVVDGLLREVWNDSTAIAAIAYVLAKQYTILKPDQATLAGLVHLIGVLPILTYAEEHRELLSNTDKLREIIRALHPEIGVRILKKWDFPDELVEVPAQYGHLDREIPTADYADLITVATLHNAHGSEHAWSDIDLSTVTAFDRLGLDSDIYSADDNDMQEHIEMTTDAFQ